MLYAVNDNDDLANRARVLLNRMCGVMPPRPLIHPVLDAIFKAIQTSPVSSYFCQRALRFAANKSTQSWRVRLKILPLVQVYYFRQGPTISEIKLVEMVEVSLFSPCICICTNFPNRWFADALMTKS